MKTLLAACTAWLCMSASFYARASAPSLCAASPYPAEVPAGDGHTVTLLTFGNAAVHYRETTDGYTVLTDDAGRIVFAEPGPEGRIVPSRVRAADPADRRRAQRRFLSGVSTHLRASAEAERQQLELFTDGAESHRGEELRFPNVGEHRVLVLLIDYPDLPATFDPSDFDALMNEEGYAGTGSFRDFFLKNSFGALDVQADVAGWYTAAHEYGWYGYQNGYQRARVLMAEAIDAAEAAGVDFSQYDNDGDGEVDAVIGIHAGPGAEMGAQIEYIWSHRWDLGSMSRQYDGVTVSDYIVNPETRPWGMVGIGVICHEFGHALGLPDLYDIDNSSRGIGNWGVMGNGSWLGSEQVPANFNAWSRSELAWITPEVIEQGAYQLHASDSHDDCYRINTGDPDEYFLLENRQKTGNDAHLPGHGLAVWHIDESKTSLYPGSNAVNADETRKGVDLEEADGLDQLDFSALLGDAGDLYPGSTGNSEFTPVSYPASSLNDGAATGIEVTNIREIDGAIHFRLNDPLTCAIYQAHAEIIPDCASGTYSAGITIEYEFLPESGALLVNGTTFQPAGSPQTVVLEDLPADGEPVDLTIGFTGDLQCTWSLPEAWTAPRPYDVLIEATTCDPAEAGTVVEVFTAQGGCDSIVTVYTELLSSYEQVIQQTSCRQEESGTEVFTYSAASGCDSIITTITAWVPADTTMIESTTCDPSEAGQETLTFLNQAGCDSMVIYHTRLLTPVQHTVAMYTCDPDQVGVEWQQFPGMAANGCDSTVTIFYRQAPVYHIVVEDTVCRPAHAGSDTFFHQTVMGCDSTVIVVHRYIPPVAGFTAVVSGRHVQLENTSEHADLFLWIWDGGHFSTEAEPSITLSGTAPQLLILIAGRTGCPRLDVEIQWIVPGSSDESGSSSATYPGDVESAEVTAYPNPTFGPLQLETRGLSKENTRMRVIDVQGRVVMDRALPEAEVTGTVDLSSIGPGIYTIQVEDEQRSAHTRVFLTN